MSALKIVRATVDSENGRYVVLYILEDGSKVELHDLTQDEAERRAARVGDYVQLPD
jgi:hypothetical protein